MKTVGKPVRLLLIFLVLSSMYVARMRASLRASNLSKAIEISNGVQHALTTRVMAEMDNLLKDLSWEEMLRNIDSFFADSQFDRVPNLFSISTAVLLERAEAAATTLFAEYKNKLLQSQRTIIHTRLPTVSEITINNLRVAMSQYTSDAKLLETFERNMELVSGSIAETAGRVITANTQKRLERLAYIFDRVIEWKKVAYQRFLYHVLRIRFEMNPGSQLETWVQLETQQIVADKHMTGYLQTALFEMYVGDSAGFINVLDKKYEGESDVYADLDVFFSKRASRVASILKSQYTRVYGIRVETIEADAVLDDDQKRELMVYARDERQKSESTDVIVSSSIGEIRSLYLDYGGKLLKQLKVVVLASFLEYEAISFRAMAEGRQTCIIQFFEMRRAIDAPFLLEYSKDRGFDLQLARTELMSAFDLSMKSAGANMLSLARTGRILYMYDEARTFVLARANIFFRDDNILLAAVKPLLLKLHDDYASIVPVRLQQGIDEELHAETQLAYAYVDATFTTFAVNMEFSLVAEMISGAKESILQDVVGKTSFLHEDFGRLTTELVTETLNPFDFAWFNAQAEGFATDDKIRYIDMKEHVVDQTNRHATIVMRKTRSTYTTQIDSLFEKVYSFVGDVVGDLEMVIDATTLQDDASLKTLRSLLRGMKRTMSSLANTIHRSTMVKLEASLSAAIEESGEAQGVRLQNFFNTKIQLIKDDFNVQITERVVRVYEQHMASIEDKMLEISTMARELYRHNVDELIELERSHRLEVEEVVAPVLEEEAEAILADYNIISFGARQSTLELGMRNKAVAAAREVAAQRRLAKLRFDRKWVGVRRGFRAHFFSVAEEAKVSFRHDVIGVVNFAKTLAVDIMGHVTDVIDSLEREIFSALEKAYTNVIDTVIGTHDNELPETLDFASVVFAQGVMDLTETPVIPALAFLKDTQEEGADTEYGDNGEALPSVDEPSGLTTLDIVLALMPWDDWLKGKVHEIVEKVTFDMQDDLKQNTCRHNKPPCREGWVQYTTEPWGVECCRFSPAEQGFPAWAITKMLAKEILLALVLDLGTLIEGTQYAAKKFGKSKLGIKASAKGKKLLASSMNKFAGKSPQSMTKAIKLAKLVKAQAMKKVAAKMGTKVGLKVAKVGAKLALAGSKFMAKLSLGPLGIALMIFDVVSLVLDLWDPAGYNDAQMAGEIRVERDTIEKYYNEELGNIGFDNPLLADPMFNMSPEQQEELQHTAIMGWIEGEVVAFQTKNDVAFESMPESEVTEALSAEYDRLSTVLDEDPNLGTTLIAAKLENVFLQDISVRESHYNPFTDGGKDSSRKHTRKNLPASGIMEIVLNETGVEAFNRLQAKKVAFVTSMKWNPMKRFVRRENDYYITKACVYGGYQKQGEQKKPEQIKVHNEDWNPWNPFSPSTRMQEIYPPIDAHSKKHLPTKAGSRAFAKSLPANLASLKNEILTAVNEGWTLVDVDAEDEFWAQFDSDKSADDMLDRSTYQASHEKNVQAARADYELTVDTYISAKLEADAPEGAQDVNADHLKVVHLALSTENWSTHQKTGKQVLKYPVSDVIDDVEKTVYTLETLPVIPDWALTYPKRRKEVTKLMESSFKESYDLENAALVEAYNKEVKDDLKRVTARARKEGKTKQDVRREEQAAGRNTDSAKPDFAVFLNGYGQSSPLYSIYEKCQSMGYGVKYNEQKGLCSFTVKYCKRYGLDFFYNADLGVYDCELSRTQAALEYIFGTTITRSAKRALGAASLKNAVVGSCHKALGSVRIYGGVAAKHVQNAESLNYMQPRSALQAIKTLGLSGF